jgi:hypothetical protein
MKITIRTSARVLVYPADAVLTADRFLPSADAVKTASARTHVDTRRAATGPRGHGGPEFRISPIKEGALPLFPHFQPNPVE